MSRQSRTLEVLALAGLAPSMLERERMRGEQQAANAQQWSSTIQALGPLVGTSIEKGAGVLEKQADEQALNAAKGVLSGNVGKTGTRVEGPLLPGQAPMYAESAGELAAKAVEGSDVLKGPQKTGNWWEDFVADPFEMRSRAAAKAKAYAQEEAAKQVKSARDEVEGREDKQFARSAEEQRFQIQRDDINQRDTATREWQKHESEKQQAQFEASQRAAAEDRRTQRAFQLQMMRENHASAQAIAEMTSRHRAEDKSIAQTSELRKEFNANPQVKDFHDVDVSLKKMTAAAKIPSAAGDMSLIYGYMKALDSGTGVKEGEYATAQNAAGIPEQIVSLYNRAKNGERLSPAQRADFLDQARKLHAAHKESYDATVERYTGLAVKQGLEPTYIVDVAPPPQQPTGPADPFADVR